MQANTSNTKRVTRAISGKFGMFKHSHFFANVTGQTVKFGRSEFMGCYQRGVAMNMDETTEDLEFNVVVMATLPISTWEIIKHTAQTILNDYAEQYAGKGGRGRFTKRNKLDAETGRQLMTLVFAVETLSDPDEIAHAAAAWAQLHNAERTWLFARTMTYDHTEDRAGMGWRAAIRHGLTAGYKK